MSVTPVSVTMQKGSENLYEAVAFSLAGGGCLAAAGYRQERLVWLLRGRQSPACLLGDAASQPCASCAGRAPSPDNGAIHHGCLQERVCSGVVQRFLATSASLSPAPRFVPAEAGVNLACWVFIQ